jgi:hypothetical protein
MAVEAYRLLAGQHIGFDYTQEPLKDPETGEETDRYPPKTFGVNEIVYSEGDLVKRFGPEKFAYVARPTQQQRKAEDEMAEIRETRRKMKERKQQRLQERKGEASGMGAADDEEDPGMRSRTPGDPAPESITGNPSFAPGGQVSEGFQASTSLPDGRTVAGPHPDYTPEEPVGDVATMVAARKAQRDAMNRQAAERPLPDEGGEPTGPTPRPQSGTARRTASRESATAKTQGGVKQGGTVQKTGGEKDRGSGQSSSASIGTGEGVKEGEKK